MPYSEGLDRVWMSLLLFFFSSRRRHTRFKCDWSSDVCSSDLSKNACHGTAVAYLNPADVLESPSTCRCSSTVRDCTICVTSLIVRASPQGDSTVLIKTVFVLIS